MGGRVSIETDKRNWMIVDLLDLGKLAIRRAFLYVQDLFLKLLRKKFRARTYNGELQSL